MSIPPGVEEADAKGTETTSLRVRLLEVTDGLDQRLDGSGLVLGVRGGYEGVHVDRCVQVWLSVDVGMV